MLVGGYELAATGVLDFYAASGEKLSGGFTVADADALREFGEFIDVRAGFGGRAEGAVTDACFDVFGGVSGEGDFEIVDERGAVHSDAGDEAAFHKIDQDGAEADFDDVAADAPENGSALFAGAVNGAEEPAKILGGENLREPIHKFCERCIFGRRLCKVADSDFAVARGKRVGVNGAERDRMNGVDAHGEGNTVNVKAGM